MFAKAAAKKTTSIPPAQIDNDSVNSNNGTHSHFESENSPGKENQINIEKENEAIEHKNKDNSGNFEKENEEKQQKKNERGAKLEKHNCANAAGNRKRGNSQRKNTESHSKRRKRIQV